MRATAIIASIITTGVGGMAVLLGGTPLAPAVRAFGVAVTALCLLAAGFYYWTVVRRRPSKLTWTWMAMTAGMPAALACTILPNESTTVDVRVPAGRVTLAATLHLPTSQNEGPIPGVVIVHGSTRQTRNSLFGLYRSVAEGFAKRGIAALVYDKRGCGESTGEYPIALFEELSADAAAALAWMAARKDIDATRLGLWGISQGGWVATRAAERSEQVRFLVLVSAPMSTEGEQRIFEWMKRLRAQGVPEEHQREAAQLQRLIWDYYGSGEGWQAVSSAWERARSSPWWPLVEGLERGGPAPPQEVLSPAGEASLRWQRTDCRYDPHASLGGLPIPVLALYGGRDEIIPIPASYERACEVVDERDDRGSRVVLYRDAKHPLMEFGPLPRFPKGYLGGMSEWIASTGSPEAPPPGNPTGGSRD
jgi:pimeloyl-ACP methyl ester carboxylesterase